MLRLRQPLETDLHLDPLTDVAGDGDQAAGAVGQLDRLQHEFDRDGTAAGGPQLCPDGGDLPLAVPRGLEHASQPLHVVRVDERVHPLPDQLCGGQLEQIRGRPIDVADHVAIRIEHEDRFDHRVQDRLGEAAVMDPLGTRGPGHAKDRGG